MNVYLLYQMNHDMLKEDETPIAVIKAKYVSGRRWSAKNSMTTLNRTDKRRDRAADSLKAINRSNQRRRIDVSMGKD